MSILALTLLCVYVHYNALGLYIKLFALYKNIFFMKVIKTEIRFKTGFPKNPVLTSLLYLELTFPQDATFTDANLTEIFSSTHKTTLKRSNPVTGNTFQIHIKDLERQLESKDKHPQEGRTNLRLI